MQVIIHLSCNHLHDSSTLPNPTCTLHITAGLAVPWDIINDDY